MDVEFGPKEISVPWGDETLTVKITETKDRNQRFVAEVSKNIACDMCGANVGNTYSEFKLSTNLDVEITDITGIEKINLCARCATTHPWPAVHMAVALRKYYGFKVIPP